MDNLTVSSGVLAYEFSDLGITSSGIEKMMGYEPGSSPDPIGNLIQNALAEAGDLADIKGGYAIIPHFLTENNTIIVGDNTFATGKIVTQYIKKSDSLAFFIITAGNKIEDRSKECFSGNDPMKGYVYDVLGSETVEAAVEKMMADLELDMQADGLKITHCYSPGYCGWPIGDQHILFSLFPEKFCGITLSETALMNPIKSVSGVIGIGPDVKKNPYSCQICDAQNCIYRDKR